MIAQYLFGAAAIVALTLSLASCGGGGSSGNNTTYDAVANFTASQNVEASSTFNVGVSLTSLLSDFRFKSSAETFNISLSDTGTLTPKITCTPSTEAVTLDGAAADFTCTSSTATGSHELTVSGPSNLVISHNHIHINVYHTGSVSVTATPSPVNAGSGVTVAFTGSGATGTYGLSDAIPSSWMTSGTTCSITTGNSTCSLVFTVPTMQPDGALNFHAITDLNGSSLYTSGRTSVPLEVTVQNSQLPKLELTAAQGISDTLYTTYGLSSIPSNIWPEYQPIIYFHNTTSGTLSLGSGSIENESSSGLVDNLVSGSSYYYSATLNPSLPMTTGTLDSGFTVPANGYFAIKLPVLTSITASSSGSVKKHITFQVKSSSGTSLGQYTQDLRYVNLIPGDMAIYVKNQTDPIEPLYFTAVGKHSSTNTSLYQVNFNSSGVGTLSSTAGTAISTSGNYVDITNPNGQVIYLPNMISGKVYITQHQGGFVTSSVPSEATTTIPFAVFEYTAQDTTGPNCDNGDEGSTYCQYLYFDQSYVNSFFLKGRFNMMGQAGSDTNFNAQTFAKNQNFGLTTSGQTTSLSTIVSGYQTEAAGTSGWDSSSLIKNLTVSNGVTTPGLVAPISIATYNTNGEPTSQNPFSSGYYNTYSSALWTYLANHPIYVLLNGDTYTSGSGNYCVAKGSIVNGQLVFTETSGEYNPATYTIDTSGSNNISCKSSVTTTANAPFAGYTDTLENGASNQVKMDQLNDCDFLQAAGSYLCHPDSTSADTNVGAYGPDATFRAWIGETLASFQATGLLPLCPTSHGLSGSLSAGEHYVLSKSLASYIITSGSNTFTNPNCIGLTSGASPTYNLYVKYLRPYTDVYTYSYGDFLGLDGTVSYNRNSFPPASGLQEPKNDYLNQLAFPQPITIKISS